MRKAVLFLLALGVIAVLAFAQSKSQSNPQAQPGSGTTMMMNCPMMSKAPGPQMGGGMRQGMMAMFGLSADEVSSALTAKKDVLGLTEAQVKEMATLIASLQQQKLDTGMQRMMGQMMAGTMKCPCRQSKRLSVNSFFPRDRATVFHS